MSAPLTPAEAMGLTLSSAIQYANDCLARGWDPDEVARARGDCALPIAALLAELAEVRPQSAALVRGLGAADLARTGLHPKVGPLSVNDILQEWVHHDRNHIKQALTNVQAHVWSAMGNTQKFSRA